MSRSNGPSDRASFATHDVHVISGFGPNTGGTRTVRFFAERMESLLGQKVIVDVMEDENRKLEGVRATIHIAESTPDGHTIYINAGGLLAANQNILRDPPVDIANELQVIGTITKPPNTLIVRADSPFQTLGELTTAMKEKGASSTYGNPNGSVVRIVSALYKQLAGLETKEVVYHASTEVIKDLISGVIDFAFSNNVFSVAREREGLIRILAISLPERLDAAPQYETFAEYGYPVDVDGWWGGFVPSATPRPIVDELNTILSTVVASQESKQFLNDTISDPWIQSPDQAQAHLREQIKMWSEYVQIAHFEQQ